MIGNTWNVGRTPWNKGKKVGNGSSTSFKKGQSPWNKGMKGYLSKEKHYRWAGGSPLIEQIRHCFENNVWKKNVFMRDRYICQVCLNPKRGYTVNADHIKPISQIIKEKNISTVEEAISCKELWDIDNGRTLCVPCHKKTPTYGGKKRTVLCYS